MSLLTQLRLKAMTWLDAHPQIEAAGASILKVLGDGAKAVIAAEVSLAKQFASDAISDADTHAAPLLNVTDGVIEQAFRSAVTAYLGPLVEKAAEPFVFDAIDKIRDGLIAQAHVLALQIKGELAAKASTPAAAPATVLGAPA